MQRASADAAGTVANPSFPMHPDPTETGMAERSAALPGTPARTAPFLSNYAGSVPQAQPSGVSARPVRARVARLLGNAYDMKSFRTAVRCR